MRVADWIVSRLAHEGITEVFTLPGGGAMFLNDALASHAVVQAVPCQHEQACGIAAEAYGRVHPSGFGVAMVTTGPGATNVITPVAGAWIESLPLMVLSGQVKRPDRIGARPLRQGGVQEVDVVPMVQSVTKYAVTILDANDVASHVEAALHHMRDGRPGPVWLDIPLDIQAAPMPDVKPRSTHPSTPQTPTDLDAALVAVETLLNQSKRPLLLAGHGVRIAGASKLFQTLVHQLQIPCVFTWNAADLLPYDDDLYIGRPGTVAARAPNFAVQNADCLIAIGCRLDNVVTAYNPKDFARQAKKVVVDVDAEEINKLPEAPEVSIVANAFDVLEHWLSNLHLSRALQWQTWRDTCLSWKSRYPAHEGHDLQAASPINHYALVNLLSEHLPEEHLIATGSSGLAIEVFYASFRNKPGQRVFLTSGLGAMGYGIAAAIGACIANGRAPCYCIESDGSLMLNIQELATIAAQKLPITIVAMNNGGYASIRNTQTNYFDQRFLGVDAQSGLLIPSLTSLAQAFSLSAVRVETHEALILTLREPCFGPRLIEVVLEQSETLTPKCAAMPQADGSMLSMPLEDMTPLLSAEQIALEMDGSLAPQSLKARGLH